MCGLTLSAPESKSSAAGALFRLAEGLVRIHPAFISAPGCELLDRSER